MYHVAVIGIISLIVYLLSLAGSKYGFYSSKGHRAFWNTILLITFLVTATAGIFLALQSNHKWDIGNIEKILNWHVEFGLGLSFTAIIHLTWHLGYYKKIFTSSGRKNETSDPDEKNHYPAGYFISMLMILGFLSGVVQVIFLREILNLSGGYEIAAGAVFACWILVSALGARSAGISGKVKTAMPGALLPLAAILSFLLFAALSYLLLDEGVTPGILFTLLITGIALLPFCFLSGYIFVRLSFVASSRSVHSPGRSFALETIGGMIAGILVTIISGTLLGNFQILIGAILLYYIIYINSLRIKFKGLLSGIIAVCLVAVLIFSPDTLIRDLLLRSVRVTSSIDTKYGNIAVSKHGGERNIFYNHRLVEFEADARQREENIHFAMVQHASPEDILIISGGADRHIQEALKYESVKSITYIERDPGLMYLTRDTAIAYPQVKVILETRDAFNYIRGIDKKFDVIISLLGLPGNLVTNRFYTKEYFSYIKEILAEDGVLMLKAGASSSYISEEENGFISTVYNSLSEVFASVLAIKGESIFLLASDANLQTSIAGLISQRGIDNVYVNSSFINDNLMMFDSEQIMAVIETDLPVNTLDRPLALFYNQRHEMEKTGGRSLPLLIVLSSLLLIPFFAGNSNSRSMYSTSFNLAGTELLALIIIQSTAGNFYHLAGLLIAVVMAGLAAGSYSGIKISQRLVNMSPVILAFMAIIFALISPVLLDIRIRTLPVIISLLIVFIPAFVTGYFYSSKTNIDTRLRSISGIYFADLCGAALGFLIIAGIIVPVYGIKTTFYILAFVNFASYITNQLIIGTRKMIR